MICRELKIADVHIPKCGGTSRAEGVAEHGYKTGPDQLKHSNAPTLRAHAGEDWGDYLTLTVVRHPYDIHVSLYHYRRDVLEENNYHKIPPHVSFEQWMKEYVADPAHKLEDELTDCLYYLEDVTGKIIVEHVFRFDELQKAWDLICDHAGFPRSVLPKKNASNHAPSREFFNGREDLKQIVWDHCERGIEVFGWEV